MLIRLFITSLFQASSSLLHVHKFTCIANHDDYTICLRYVVHQLGFDPFFYCDVIHDHLDLGPLCNYEANFFNFFVFGNGGHGGSVSHD